MIICMVKLTEIIQGTEGFYANVTLDNCDNFENCIFKPEILTSYGVPVLPNLSWVGKQ